MGARVSKSKCPSCGGLSIRTGATKCPSCQAWVQPPRFSKRRLRLSPLGIVGFTVGLCIAGMVSGVVAAVTAQGRRSAPRMSAPTNPSDTVESPASSTDQAASAAPNSSDNASKLRSVATDPPAAEGKFVKTEQVRLDAPPAAISFSADESFFFVLAEDGSLRGHDAASGAEKRRLKLPGRGKSLKSLPGGKTVVLGLPAEIVIVDEAKWALGKPEAEVIVRSPLRDVVDVVSFDEPPRIVAITGQGGRVLRLSANFSAIEAEFVSVPPATGLATLRLGGSERIALTVPSRPPADPGAIILFDPASASFGVARASWFGLVDPRVTGPGGSDSLLLFDPATASVVDFSFASERRIAPAGPQPIAAFRWANDRAVVIGVSGTASFVSLGRREVEATVALGAIPSAAVGTPDRRVVVVALGGGARGRGNKTVVVAGEPPAIESTIETGDGSHLVAMAAKGTQVAVGAIGARAVTLVVRK